MGVLQRVVLAVGVVFLPVVLGESPIKHLVVLMMENRSFDHMLGWYLKQQNPNVDGLTGTEYNCANPSQTSSNGCIFVNHNGYDTSPDDPYHDFDSITEQIYGFDKSISDESSKPKMNGFVWNAEKGGHSGSNPMSMFDDSSAPVINTLALEYAVFDRWFCSVPSSTDPNRGYAMSGTSNGMLTNYNGTHWNQMSYFEFLRRNGVSWKGYYDVDVWALGYFADMVKQPNSANIEPISDFFNILEGKSHEELPSFSWLQPKLSSESGNPPNWQHPCAPVSAGEELISEVYDKLKASKYWNESALLITYDEHGGFYDHVGPPSPASGVTAPYDGVKASNGFKFDRLGVRIPTVLVSPWIAKGTVISDPCDECKPDKSSQWESTSTLHTANKLFGVRESITERQAWAATFESYFGKSADGSRMKEPRAGPFELNSARSLLDQSKLTRRYKQKIVEQLWKEPLEEHMKIQVQYYCKELSLPVCPNPSEMNQKEYSEFVAEHVPRFMNMIRNR